MIGCQQVQLMFDEVCRELYGPSQRIATLSSTFVVGTEKLKTVAHVDFYSPHITTLWLPKFSKPMRTLAQHATRDKNRTDLTVTYDLNLLTHEQLTSEVQTKAGFLEQKVQDDCHKERDEDRLCDTNTRGRNLRGRKEGSK
eukprot:5260974-Amphidinium_carterae.1